ncbi:MAG: hypothetical protein OEW58_10790 [Gammaproteobacteria bacterium]|nr:hypothetical protein [Gammaproteobacteria bacterium]
MNNKHLLSRFASSTTIVAALVLSGCASTPETIQAAQTESAVQAQPAVQAAEVAPLSIVKPKAIADSSPAEPGSYASLVKKLRSKGLYWREKQSYTYDIGREIGAEYQPDQGLKVSANAAEGSLECRFKSDGSFSGDEASKAACDKVMFTLDQEIGE